MCDPLDTSVAQDIRNGVLFDYPAQKMPAMSGNSAGNVEIQWLTWTGVPAAWDETSSASYTLARAKVREIGEAILSVLTSPGAAPINVVDGGTTVVVDVHGGAGGGVTLKFNADAAIPIVADGWCDRSYAELCGRAMAEV